MGDLNKVENISNLYDIDKKDDKLKEEIAETRKRIKDFKNRIKVWEKHLENLEKEHKKLKVYSLNEHGYSI